MGGGGSLVQAKHAGQAPLERAWWHRPGLLLRLLLVCTPIESVLLVCTGTYGVQADMERRLDKAAYGTAETRVTQCAPHHFPVREHILQ